MILVHVAVVKNIKIVVEEINKTCKALKSRAFYYTFTRLFFTYVITYVAKRVYKTYVNYFLKSKIQYFQRLQNICTTATVT